MLGSRLNRNARIAGVIVKYELVLGAAAERPDVVLGGVGLAAEVGVVLVVATRRRRGVLVRKSGLVDAVPHRRDDDRLADVAIDERDQALIVLFGQREHAAAAFAGAEGANATPEAVLVLA